LGPGSAEAINDREGIVGYMTDPDTGNGGPAVWQQAQITLLNNGGVATAINDRGQVVGWNMEGTGFAEQSAFLWQNGKLTLLEFGTVNEATNINNRGQVVGTEDSSEAYWENPEAFLWQAGEKTSLGGLGGGGSYASAINDRGQVVGESKTASGVWHAFLWESGRMRDLGTLGGKKSAATSINERGEIVGTSTTQSGQTHAFLWQRGTMRDLGPLGGSDFGTRGERVPAINERGQVVGSTTVKDKDGHPVEHAFLWQNGTMHDLGTLPGGGASGAMAINNHNQIIGWATTKTGQQRAVLWTLRSG
jgi:probable HAF family extracellular repeat protein